MPLPTTVADRIASELEPLALALTEKLETLMKDIPLTPERREEWIALNDTVTLIRRQQVLINHLRSLIEIENDRQQAHDRLRNL